MKEMKDSEVIAAAQDLIRDPEAWVKGHWCIPRGKDRVEGCPVGGADFRRDRYCLEGAIGRALGQYERRLGLPVNFTPEERKEVLSRRGRLFRKIKVLLP